MSDRTGEEAAGESPAAEGKTGIASLMVGRRKLLVLGGAGLGVLASGAGAAAALIRAGGNTPSPRSANPVGLDPSTGRNNGAVGPAPLGVRMFALAGTDGWATIPSSSFLSDNYAAEMASRHIDPNAIGVNDINPYFPDPQADSYRTTYVFSFRNVTALDRSQVAAQKGRTQYCAPLWYSTVGEELWVTLSNLGLFHRPDLVDGHTLHWHGFRNAIPFYDGVPESSISVPIGHDFTYVYRPQDAGTYMYHCHFEDVEHVTMGMQGIVFVKPDPRTYPSGTEKRAYGPNDGDATGQSKYVREYAILLGEVDVRAHFNDAHIQATDWTDFHADFAVMNGRSYPDTLAPNSVRDAAGDLHGQSFTGWTAPDSQGNVYPILSTADDASLDGRLASNPLSSLVLAAPGERVLVRFANLGFINRSIVFPGLQIDVLGRDARFVPLSAQRDATDTIQIGPGESRDVFITAPATPGDYPFYDRGMSHYPGSADGSDAWVGGARSAVRVVANLGPQHKPNGWAGEIAWNGEFPMTPSHGAPVISAQGRRIPAVGGPSPQPPRWVLDGNVTVDAGKRLTDLFWVRSNPDAVSTPAPPIGDSRWNPADFASASPGVYSFADVLVGPPRNAGNGSHYYWMIARDDAGTWSSPVQVKV